MQRAVLQPPDMRCVSQRESFCSPRRFSLRESLGEKEDGDKAAGVLRNGSGAGVYHILHQDLQHAVGRQRDAVQHAFIVLVGNWYGPKAGVLVGLVFGILQFIQEPYVLSFFQVCCDYILAFAALGVAGFFAKNRNGLVAGYIVAVIARGAFHALGGYLYWMDYMPENFPKALTSLYPILYNYSYLLAEGVITVIIISIPAVAKGFKAGETDRAGIEEISE